MKINIIDKVIKNLLSNTNVEIGDFRVEKKGTDTTLAYKYGEKGWRTVVWVVNSNSQYLPKKAIYLNFINGYDETLLKVANKISKVGNITQKNGVLYIGETIWLGNRRLLQVEN